MPILVCANLSCQKEFHRKPSEITGRPQHCSVECAYPNKDSTVICQNPLCGKLFHAKQSQIKLRQARFCSSACRQYRIEVLCDNSSCHKKILLKPFQLQKATHYCSKNCAYIQDRTERFWSYVEKTDGCWLWSGYINPRGYGMFNAGKNKIALAHRFAYEMSIGKITDGLYACHKCDNRRCVRPDHFFLGTHEDNINDARKKGRMPARIDKEKISHIVSSRNSVSAKELSRIHGCHISSIYSIWKRCT